MRIEHIAIWTEQLELLKSYYETYFDGRSNDLYVNETTGFRSYFLEFASGSRLELMSRPGIPANANDPVQQYSGLIHFAFEVSSMQAVDEKAAELSKAGYTILRGPRKTGDGYYEFETLDPDRNRLEVMSLFRDE